MNKTSWVGLFSLILAACGGFVFDDSASAEIKYYDKYVKLLNKFSVFKDKDASVLIETLGEPMKKFIVSPCKHDVTCEYYVYRFDPLKFFGDEARRGVNPDHIIFIINADKKIFKIEAY